MKLGVRGKLFVVSVLLMVGVGLISGVVLEHSLRGWLTARAEQDLWRQARTARDMIEMSPAGDSSVLNSVAWRLEDSTGARVTLISPAGTVLADSQMGDSTVIQAENHLSRVEVQMALQEGRGMARRFSDTLHTPMLYAALPVARADLHGVVRVAMSLAQVEDAVGKLRIMLAGAGLVGLAATLFISGLASHFASRALRDLTSHAQKIARGEQGRRMAVWPEDEIGGIAGSFNQLADHLERVVSTLGHERDQVATILESMNEAVLALDRNQRITLINGAAIGLLGTISQPLGTTLVQSANNPALRQLAAKSCAGEAVREELTLGERRLLARATPLLGQGGSVVVMHDITDVRRLETIRRDFVANVSHELRTPVSVIRANAETLLDGALEDPKAARPFVEALLRNSERLGRIIADLLDISRVEAGQLQLRTQPVALSSAARRAAEALQPTAQAKNIAVSVRIDEGVTVLGDMQALDQVLLNLLDNAVKYTPEGGHVQVGAVVRGEQVRIEVADDGPGLEPHQRKRVFERFYRVDPGRSRDMGGTGLGLSIVKHLCETMGGKAGVDPGSERGSVFWFVLPRADQADEALLAS